MSATQPEKTFHDQVHAGAVSFSGSVNLPDGAVGNTQIKLDATNLVDADKLEHRRALAQKSPIGSDVAALDEIVHIFDAAAVIEDVSVVCETAPAGGDKKAVIDVQIYTSSWASILSGGAQDVDSSYSDNTRQVLTLSGTPTAVAGNLLRITRTVSGSTGSHAQGMTTVVKYTEAP
jgi:hypothetical protein